MATTGDEQKDNEIIDKGLDSPPYIEPSDGIDPHDNGVPPAQLHHGPPSALDTTAQQGGGSTPRDFEN